MIAICEETFLSAGRCDLVEPQGIALSPGKLEHFKPNAQQCQHYERMSAPNAGFGVQGEDGAEHGGRWRQSEHCIPRLVGCQADRKPRWIDTRGSVGVDDSLPAVQPRPNVGRKGRQLYQRDRQDADQD